MTSVNLDFSGVEAAKPFEPLPNGVYTLKIENATIQESKNADKGVAPNFNLQLRHEDGKHVVFHLINMGPKSAPWVLQFLEAVYQTPPASLSLSTEDERNEWCASLIGVPVSCSVLQRYKKGPDGKPDGSEKKENFVDAFLPYAF